MLFIITRAWYNDKTHRRIPERIIKQHYATKSAALDYLINWDFVYAEWCGSELKSADLSGH